ncbi:MAG: hypothetical protein IPH85_01910 [Ignavibacteria bacterium]|nr:hypothetical protein [Ignavibacteria bacterium]MBK7184675.1 hypothetical protein [Ignavibacteria bacterium]
MEAMESLLMDMLDDGPATDAELEAFVLHHDDRTLVADMQRMHAMSPLLKQCVIPVSTADAQLLSKIRTSVHSSISSKLLLMRTLWSGLGAAVGGGILWLTVAQWNGDASEATQHIEPSPASEIYVATPTVEPRNVPSQERAFADRTPVSTNGVLRAEQNDLELRNERDRREALARYAVGADAYRQYRDLFHINLALSDTTGAISALRSAKRWAEQTGDMQASERCEREIIDLTRTAAR